MAKIKIDNIKPTGYELFSDFESYLKDLSEEELAVHGGIPTPIIPVVTSSEPCALFVFSAITVIAQPD
jgi:hypothetical protein